MKLFTPVLHLPVAMIALIAALSATVSWAAEGESGQSLGQAASDPTASLLALQLQNVYVGDFHNLDDENTNTVQFRAAVPFNTGTLKHIARATLPMITDSLSGKRGLGDLVLFDLIVFERDWGRFGVGPVMLFPTASSDEIGARKWAAGPALGFAASSPKLVWGLFNQNLFSFAGDGDRDNVNVSILQPLFSYSLPQKWSIGVSEMNVTYDWRKRKWVNLPLGAKLSKLIKFGDLPIQFSGYYEYNFADDEIAPEWTVNFTAKFLFPL